MKLTKCLFIKHSQVLHLSGCGLDQKVVRHCMQLLKVVWHSPDQPDLLEETLDNDVHFSVLLLFGFAGLMIVIEAIPDHISAAELP